MPIKSFYNIGHPISAYSPEAVVFDGTNDNLTKSGNLTGVSDGKLMTWSMWIRPVGAAHEWILYNEAGNIRFGVQVTTSGLMRQYGRNTSLQVVLNHYSSSAFSMNEWVHVMGCADVSDSNKCLIYVNGVLNSGTPTTIDSNIDLTPTSWKICSKLTDDVRYGGELADVWWDDSYLDLSDSANRAKFISGSGSGATPVNLGSDGSTPTGASPAIFFKGEAATWNAGTNSGAGGNFTMTGAVEDSSNEPVVVP